MRSRQRLGRIILRFLAVMCTTILPAHSFAATFSYPLINSYLTSSLCSFNGTCAGTGTTYHTGVDLGGDTVIYPSAPGRVVAIQLFNLPSPGFTQCNGPDGSCQDHGVGNTVILEHTLTNGMTVYSQYSHLASIAGIALGQHLSVYQSIGVMGGSGYNSLTYWPKHLHFEIKTGNAIGNPSGSGSYWGYTPGPAQDYGYLNPSDIINNSAYQTTENCTISVGAGSSDSELLAFQAAYAAGSGLSTLGCPTSTVSVGFTSFAGTIGHFQAHESGEIEYLMNGGYAGQAFAVVSPLFNKWASFGFNVNNFLGHPISQLSSESTSCFETLLKYQRFEGGALEWHLSGGRSGAVCEVHGAIYTKWGQKGYAGCPLGLPISDERDAQASGATGKTGRVSDFEGGHIHWWTNALEAFETHGAIDSLYVSMGGSASWLGFPTSDEFVAATGYARSNFEGGHITTTDGINYQAFTYDSQCYSLSTSSNPTTGGSVTVNTSSNCSGGYTAGTAVLLVATPAANYVFSNWTGTGGTFADSALVPMYINTLTYYN